MQLFLPGMENTIMVEQTVLAGVGSKNSMEGNRLPVAVVGQSAGQLALVLRERSALVMVGTGVWNFYITQGLC
jgi:hypothetical protein